MFKFFFTAFVTRKINEKVSWAATARVTQEAGFRGVLVIRYSIIPPRECIDLDGGGKELMYIHRFGQSPVCLHGNASLDLHGNCLPLPSQADHIRRSRNTQLGELEGSQIRQNHRNYFLGVHNE